MSGPLGVIHHAVVEATTAVGPIGIIVVGFHLADRRSRSRLVQVCAGLGLAFVGLTLFLAGVELAFLPAGESVAGAITEIEPWLVVPVAFVFGVVAALAEPAVRLLRFQVDRVSAGGIDGRLLVGAIAVGVGLVVAVAVVRIIVDFPLWWILVPAYGLAFAIAPLADRRFVGMAFDSGGVATGPMAVTFLLALAVGTATAIPGRDPAVTAFGLVSLIAVAPILTVLLLGVLYRHASVDYGEEANDD